MLLVKWMVVVRAFCYIFTGENRCPFVRVFYCRYIKLKWVKNISVTIDAIFPAFVLLFAVVLSLVVTSYRMRHWSIIRRSSVNWHLFVYSAFVHCDSCWIIFRSEVSSRNAQRVSFLRKLSRGKLIVICVIVNNYSLVSIGKFFWLYTCSYRAWAPWSCAYQRTPLSRCSVEHWAIIPQATSKHLPCPCSHLRSQQQRSER